jgi:hypothetical protein
MVDPFGANREIAPLYDLMCSFRTENPDVPIEDFVCAEYETEKFRTPRQWNGIDPDFDPTLDPF